jgi:vacuolar-type H+-ATPase subunit B/Vma2
MKENIELLKYYTESVHFPQVSGFEILEMLDVRSRLALAESQLNVVEKEQLEEADEVFLMNADVFYQQVVEIADLREMRQRAAIPISHWWWYLEKLSHFQKAAATA